MTRVFISSTCYDLLDLRAELEAFFRGAGVEPVRSDSPTSVFQVSPDRNSIETCLANVRDCDHFIIILSNRYGPTLENAGYGDKSATHLEYLEAKKAGIPIHMYVRDHLEGDFAIWKANKVTPGLKLTWCKLAKDWKIFDLLEEHRQLKAAGGNNWLWTFTDSVDLKNLIRRDFSGAFASATVAELFKTGGLPLLEVIVQFQGSNGQVIACEIYFRNIGNGAAISPVLQVDGTPNNWKFKSLHSLEHDSINFEWALSITGRLDLPITLSYSTLQGLKFAEEATLSLFRQTGNLNQYAGTYTLKRKRYLGASDAALLMMPSFDGAPTKPT